MFKYPALQISIEHVERLGSCNRYCVQLKYQIIVHLHGLYDENMYRAKGNTIWQSLHMPRLIFAKALQSSSETKVDSRLMTTMFAGQFYAESGSMVQVHPKDMQILWF